MLKLRPSLLLIPCLVTFITLIVLFYTALIRFAVENVCPMPDGDVLVIEPCSGLGNRLRSLGSALKFAKMSHRSLMVSWEAPIRNSQHGQGAFSATWSDLFDLRLPVCQEHQGCCLALRLTALSLNSSYSFGEPVSGAPQLSHLKQDVPTLPWLTYVTTNGYLAKERSMSLLRDILEPSPVVAELVKAHLRQRNGSKIQIGVHARTRPPFSSTVVSRLLHLCDAALQLTEIPSKAWLNGLSVTQHPVGPLNQSGEPLVEFFVASDDQQVVHRFRERYGSAVFAFDHDHDASWRGSVLHDQEALAELLLLSRSSDLFFGTHGSSYSGMVPRLAKRRVVVRYV